MRRFLLPGALVGLLIPASLLLAADWGGYVFDGAAIAVWPSSVCLMALDGQLSSSVIAVVYALSIGANVVLYTLLAFLAFGIWRLARSGRLVLAIFSSSCISVFIATWLFFAVRL